VLNAAAINNLWISDTTVRRVRFAQGTEFRASYKGKLHVCLCRLPGQSGWQWIENLRR
jgi:hypothetical protein